MCTFVARGNFRFCHIKLGALAGKPAMEDDADLEMVYTTLAAKVAPTVLSRGQEHARMFYVRDLMSKSDGWEKLIKENQNFLLSMIQQGQSHVQDPATTCSVQIELCNLFRSRSPC